MKNRLYDLPEDVLRKIWKNVYNGVVKEIKEFLTFGKPYVYRKPNALNMKVDCLFMVALNLFGGEKKEFRRAEKFYNGNRQCHFLYFYEAILFLKKHPTGVYERSGDQIEYVFSDDESEDESESE